MREIANGRGLTPLFENGIAAAAEAGAGAAAIEAGLSQPFEGGFRRFGGVKRTLDSIGGLGWSVIGFILGAMFWHFVGFWGFVSEVVLAGGPIAAIEQRAAEPRRKSDIGALPQWVQVADASAPACTLLALDRQTGLTTARPCDADYTALPADVSQQGREDRLLVNGGADVDAGTYVGAASSP